MDKADRVHPCNGTAQLGPYPANRGFGKGKPCGISVDQRKEVAACEVGEDERVVGRGGDVRVGDVLLTLM